mgnify:CR=1 FL=1|tara:strand:+ start:128 stop:400 length:273 start_codon:yes stop_codon:yes gene_type:complete
MREIEKELGKVYEKDGFYYLEKIYDDLYSLMLEEKGIKNKAVKNSFVVHDYNWSMKKNPSYIIESLIHDGDKRKYNENIFVFKIKLEYIK